jgi:hypothetical protein
MNNNNVARYGICTFYNEPYLLNLIITCDETSLFTYDLETKVYHACSGFHNCLLTFQEILYLALNNKNAR